MRAIVVGLGSEIARNIAERLMAEGWAVHGCLRETPELPAGKWDLLILAHGTMEPIGRFFDTNRDDWADCLCVNALTPLADLRAVWPQRLPGAKVVFMGGPNMSKPSPTYSAYRCGKAILEAIVPSLNAEYPGHKFYVLHPGVVNTKIHQQTIAAGKRAANLEWAERLVRGEEKSVSHDEVYIKLKALIK